MEIHPKAKTNRNLFFAMVWLCMALTLTSGGIMLWPILVYAAAPCYFLTVVLFINRPALKPQKYFNVEATNIDPFF